MRTIGLRKLTAGGAPGPDRIGLLNIWFKGHNNPRYAELLAAARAVDACLLTLPDRRIPRGLGYRAFHAARTPLYAAALGRAARRYRGLLSLDVRQHPHFDGPIVADVDDPFFTEREVELLKSPHVAARRHRRAHAAVRGSSASAVARDPAGGEPARRRPSSGRGGARKRPGSVVVGWMAAHLTDGDRGAEGPLYNVDHLLEQWDEIHARAPRPSCGSSVGPEKRRRLEGRDDIVLGGRLPRERRLATRPPSTSPSTRARRTPGSERPRSRS